MNILVSGGNGQLSKILRRITKKSDHKFYYFSKKKLDITSMNSLSKTFYKYRPDYIINNAALTDVDFCELNPELAFINNSKSLLNIINVCKKYKTKLIHISSDYIFSSSSKIIKSTDIAIPENIYGYSKLLAEKIIMKYYFKHSLIIRPSWLFSSFGRNFIHHVIHSYRSKNSFTLFDNISGSPTSCYSLAYLISDLIIQKDKFMNGIINFNQGKHLSRHQFAKKIIFILTDLVSQKPQFKIKLDLQKKPIAKRPSKLFLDNSKLKHYSNLNFLNFEKDLKDTISEIMNH